MDLSEYTSIKNNPYVNFEGFDKTNCCHSLMLNSLGNWYCSEHQESLGYDQEGALKATMFCQFYYRDHNCCVDIRKKAAKEKAEKERAEEEKREAEEKTLFDKIIAGLNKQIQLNPNDAESYRLRGGAYAQRKEFKQSIDDYTKAIDLEDPNKAESYAFRGAAYAETKEYGQAITDFNNAIQLNPNCKNAYWFRAAMYIVQGEHDKSIADYEEALRIDPKDSNTTTLLKNAKELREKELSKRWRESGRCQYCGGSLSFFNYNASIKPSLPWEYGERKCRSCLKTTPYDYNKKKLIRWFFVAGEVILAALSAFLLSIFALIPFAILFFVNRYHNWGFKKFIRITSIIAQIIISISMSLASNGSPLIVLGSIILLITCFITYKVPLKGDD